jgi:quinoprotein glucose dehydrogenase
MLRRKFLAQSLAGTALLPGPRAFAATPADREWRWHAGDAHATRHSPCDQITPGNVKNLKVSWTHKTGDASTRPATTIECTPIVVDGVMYLTTPRVKVQALNAATGELLWTFDPLQGRGGRRAPGISRGVTYWEEGDRKRIFAVYQDRLWCLDAKSGKPVPSFGKEGVIDLKENFDHDMTNLNFRHTSPVVVYKDTVITGGGGGEGPYPEAPGHIRGYDAQTGERRWIFHTTPRPGEYGHDTWEGDSWSKAGGTNNWAGMCLDARRGLVYAGIGSPSFDYYGGDRKGDNLFGNCLLALDAKTGKRKWHFQIVHHDVWDYDMPQQPLLITMRQGRKNIDAVVQCTKQGFAFFFERETGKPVWPIEERPIAPSGIEGELLSKTQPFPTKPPALSRQGWKDEWITDISPEAHAHVKALVEKVNRGPLYTSMNSSGGLVHPGFRGGILWGGSSFDTKRNRLFINSDEWTNIIALERAKEGMPFRYAMKRRDVLTDQNGYPGIKPPWGYLTAIDCNKGDFAWRVVNGEYPELTAKGIKKTGTPTNGGCISTSAGLVFMAGTFDKKMRAYSSDSGDVLWEYTLPAAGFATPCTYEANGKQYVVIAAGGGKSGLAAGDEYIAFSL